MYPEIPEQLGTLSATELRALAAEIRKSVLAALADPDLDAEGLDLAEKAKEARIAVLAVARDKEAAAALAEEMGDESEDEPGPPSEVIKSPDPDHEGNYPDQPRKDGEDDDEDDEADGGEGETQATAKPKVRTSTGMAATPTAAPERVRPDQLLAVEGTPGHQAGDVFANWTDFAQAVMEKASMLDPSSAQKFHVGRAYGEFDEAHQLTENLVHNLRLFERDEMTAAMCAPAVPTYNLGCANTARRPVRNSMASFQPAQRGAVTIYPSPSLSDITAGTGIWTSTDDANASATKAACQTIACATPVEYRLYGIYRCITIKNMLQMTFPELVEAYLNRLSAAWARLAEVTLLNAMGTAATVVDSAHVGWGGSTSIVHGLLRYLSAYQELQRWDTVAHEVWIHRQVLYAIKADLMARKRTDGGRNMVPSDAEVNRLFSDAGFQVHWTLDVANWMTPVKQFSTASVLADFPRNVEMLVAPAGKFAVMDRGELNIGVTGNGMYRDNTSNSRNEFTFFFENYEGLVNTDSCPAHILELNNICWNGRQIADNYVDCEGDISTGDVGS